MLHNDKYFAENKINCGGFILMNFLNNGLKALMFAEGGQWGWVFTVTDAIKAVLVPILIIVSAAGMLYAIVIGVQMARADSTDKREEAKKRLINVIVGLAIIIALILFFQLFIDVILPALLPPDQFPAPTRPTA